MKLHTIDGNKVKTLKNYRALAFTGHINIEWYKKSSWVEIKKSYSGGHQFDNFARNCFMVDIATDVVSFKQYNSSGTDHCIKYAKKEGKYIGNIVDSKRKGEQW